MSTPHSKQHSKPHSKQHSKPPLPKITSYIYSTHYVSSYDGKHHVEEVRQVEKENDKTLLNRYEKKVDGKVVKSGKAAQTPRKTLKVKSTKQAVKQAAKPPTKSKKTA